MPENFDPESFGTEITELVSRIREESNNASVAAGISSERIQAQLLEAAREGKAVGLAAASILLAHSVPSMPWLVPEVTGTFTRRESSTSGLFTVTHNEEEFRQLGQGWHVLTETGSGPRLGGNYSLNTIGVIAKFSYLHINQYRGRQGNKEPVDLQGIIDPRPLEGDDLLYVARSDEFKRGIASLIAGMGPFVSNQ